MPSLGEVQNDPRARAEAMQKAKGIKAGHLAELCRVQKAEAERATSELRKKWRVWWRMWQNEVEFPGKEDWQTKLWVPKIFTAVEQATALVQRSILESDSPFGADGSNDRERQLATLLWNPMLKLFLTKADLAYKFADVTKVGFITGVAGYLKIRPTTVGVPRLMGAQMDPTSGRLLPSFTTQPKSCITIDYVHPWNIFRDPESRPRQNWSGCYLWHSEWKDKYSIQNMEANGWDAAMLKELLASDYSGSKSASEWMTDGQREEAERKQYSYERHKFRKSYLIDEGWLDILDENGEVVLPNALMIHSCDKILFGPVDNPIWATDLNTGRRKHPFVAGAPISHPARFEGRGIAEQDAALSQLYSNVFMLWADGLNWLINPPTEVFQDSLVDWEDLEHYPGKLWVKHTAEKALMPANMGTMDTNNIMASLEYIDRIRQNSNFVTDFAVGLPGSRSDITKGEVQIKTSQSLAIFEAMGRNLEGLGSDIVGLTYDLILQYFGDYTSPEVAGLIGPEAAMILSTIPIEQRVDMLQGNFQFKFSGVTQALMKSEQLAKVIQFATLSATPMYASLVNPANILQVIGDLLGVTDRIQIASGPPPMPPGMGMPGMPGAPPGAPTPLPGANPMAGAPAARPQPMNVPAGPMGQPGPQNGRP